MALPSICGVTSVLGCWGQERWGGRLEKKGIFGMNVVGKGMFSKVSEMVEAGEPDKGST